ncbi:RlpA-like double-psi beta-barrel-protein domain-containing protein-containing protein [Russula aff. rugulosa BPL654]|nr:RlpA-like double-psi beta-barrel-protein domain-containing protein-containing protein [Russula aff. rugulosa BPL654]
MKSALALVFLSTFASAFASHGIVHKHRCTSHPSTSQPSTSKPSTENNSTNGSGGWVQRTSGTASFTQYSGCNEASCGVTLSGFSAATNTLAFGAYRASGDACGRCFKLTSNHDPYTPSFAGPFKTIVVRVNDLCPADSNGEWCGQRVSHPVNQFNMSMHFDLCQDSGAAGAFFTGGREAMTGTFEEVVCENNWAGDQGGSLWDGSCLAGKNSPLWPQTVCGNQGTNHSFACAAM